MPTLGTKTLLSPWQSLNFGLTVNIGQELKGGRGAHREEFVYQWFLDTLIYVVLWFTRYTGPKVWQIVKFFNLSEVPSTQALVRKVEKNCFEEIWTFFNRP